MTGKIYDTIEGAVALFAFVGIVGISVISVVALNPKSSTIENESSKVAGVQTSINGSSPTNEEQELPISLSNINIDNDKYTTTLTYDQDRKIYDYVAKVEPTGNNLMQYDFINLNNPNDYDVTLEVSSLIEGTVGNILKIRVLDETDTLLIYEPGSSPIISNISIPSLGEKNLKIQYELSEKINFPFQVNFQLK